MSYQVIQVDSLEDLKALCLDVTTKAAAAVPPPSPDSEQPAYSPLAQALLTAYQSGDFGCCEKAVAGILTALTQHLTQEDLDFEAIKRSHSRGDADKPYDTSCPRFAAIVPLEEKRDHNYPVGEAFLVTHKDQSSGKPIRSLRRQEGYGNCHHGDWRYATPAEIDTLFDAFKAYPWPRIEAHLNDWSMDPDDDD